jgi:hypothetical protein
MENKDGKKGSLVFITPDSADYTQSVSVKMSLPIKKGRVDKERRWYYWTWGSQWITGIAAWIFYYSYSGSNEAAMYGYNQGSLTQELSNNNLMNYYLSIGSAVAFGVASVYGIYHMIKYIYYAGRDSAPIAPQGGKK